MGSRVCVLLAVWVAGCGPLLGPMTVRLEPKDQEVVDGMWNNMLTPVDRLDRELLLDAIVSGYLYELGVDRLAMRAEKDFARGRVVMEIDCARVNPEADQFTITVLDERGREVRRERYGREEIMRRMIALNEASIEEKSQLKTPEAEQKRVETERLRERIKAATRPAVVQ
jgi:hypothetical protein